MNALPRLWLAMMALLLLALPSGAALAQSFPPLTGRVVDAAGLLDPATVEAITQKSEALEQTTGRQLVVATVPSLEGYDIADYGYRLGRAWGIGEAERNNGVILLVAPNERRLRIEVGYGLEPVLTDALSGRIIRDVITPRFKAGDMAGGIRAGVDEISRIIELPPEEQRKLAAQASQSQRSGKADGIGPAVIFLIFIFLFVLLPLLGRLRGGRRYRGGIHPIIIWGAEAALREAFRDRDGGGGGWGNGGGWGGGGGGGFGGGGGSFGGGGASGGW
ncbi:TPM domain-containing protein [Sphingobium lignivorans]|nr:TPM domain-containing protein [Sphingobium lignivorans]